MKKITSIVDFLWEIPINVIEDKGVPFVRSKFNEENYEDYEEQFKKHWKCFAKRPKRLEYLQLSRLFAQ